MVTWCKQPTHWKSPWCWERLKAEGEEGIRRWDSWMASLMQWTWTWANFGRWWGTGRPGMLQSTGSQRVGHDWATEQQYYWALTKLYLCHVLSYHMIISFNSHDHTGMLGPSFFCCTSEKTEAHHTNPWVTLAAMQAWTLFGLCHWLCGHKHIV